MIYFVRHGQTDDNLNLIFTGYCDMPLNENGIRQARLTAHKLKNVRFDICYCSPLLRAKQTLDEILKFHKNLKIIYDDRLKEREYGQLSGKHVSECCFDYWIENENDPFGMEKISDMFQRVKSFYEQILPENKNKNILIVAHSGVGRMSHFFFNGPPENNDYTNFHIGNAGIVNFNN